MWSLALGIFLKAVLVKKKQKMAEELQKYKDILKREQKEFEKQLEKEVSTSRILSVQSENRQYVNWTRLKFYNGFQSKLQFDFFVKFCSEISPIILMFSIKNIITGSRSKFKRVSSHSYPLWERRRAATWEGMPFCLFFFFWACALKRIWNKGIEKYLKEYLLCSQLWGTILHTIDDVVVSFTWKNNAPNTPNFITEKKSCPPPSKSWSVHAHHHVVIWDLEFWHAIFSKMDNSSILHIFFAFTTKKNFFFNYIKEEVLIAAKRAWLDEIVGHLKEEEPGGEVLGESNTGSLLLPPLLFFHFDLISSSLYLFTLPLLFFSS